MTLVAFGVTGDLMRLKILPALHALSSEGNMPADMRVIGISRRPWDDTQLRAHIQEVLPQARESFLAIFTFLQGDAENPATFGTLADKLENDDAILYLSLAPTLYEGVFSNMQRAGLGKRTGSIRVMIEKPFGLSGALAERLYTKLRSVIAEEDIYLVDHYLAKDWVRDLEVLPVPHEDIVQMDLRFLENTGVEQRGASYDLVGALRDVVQNHLLQVMAHLVAPHSRAEILEQLKSLSPAQVATATVRAQYEGYRSIPGVASQSQTETYCKVQTVLNTPDWEGVKVVFEAGKRLRHTRKEVVLTLKDKSTITIAERPNKIGEYELLLGAAIQGDHSLFPSMREVRAQWRFIDSICATWAMNEPALLIYPPGSVREGV